MRLLDTSSLELKEFFDNKVPPYAILSHTWGDEEVSLEAFAKLASRSLAGFKKIEGCCALAKSKDLRWVWIDTCCIDKKSSAELSEAINSMYRWYKEAEECFAYLDDIFTSAQDLSFDHRVMARFREAKWFTRGWTLQELLSPTEVRFYDCNWRMMGTKGTLWQDISRATKIFPRHLFQPMEASIAQKMSWISARQTSRKEDMAYCLLGLFDVNMPLLYGEGDKAFMRLQHEIIKTTTDESIFAWKNPKLWSSGIFARSPADFIDSGGVISLKRWRTPYIVTNRGLDIKLEAYRLQERSTSDMSVTWVESLAPIACTRAGVSNSKTPFMIHLSGTAKPEGLNLTMRTHLHTLEASTRESRIFSRSPLHQTFYIHDTLNQKSDPTNEKIVRVHWGSHQKKQNSSLLFLKILPNVVKQLSLWHCQNLLNVATRTSTIILGRSSDLYDDPCNQTYSGLSGLLFRDRKRQSSFAFSWSLDLEGKKMFHLNCQPGDTSFEEWMGKAETEWSKHSIEVTNEEIVALPRRAGEFLWVSCGKDPDSDDESWSVKFDITNANDSAFEIT